MATASKASQTLQVSTEKQFLLNIGRKAGPFGLYFFPLMFLKFSLKIAEVAEELCKTAAGHCGPLHSFCADMPLLPSKSRILHKHTENKENIEGGLDGRPDQATLSHSGTSRHAYRPTTKSGAPHCSSAGNPDGRESKKQLKRRKARRLRRMAIIFDSN